MRLFAEVTWDFGGKTLTALTPEVELRLHAPRRSDFHAALSEGFRRPYIFGAGLASSPAGTGPEGCAGNDCANFLVAAWRRTGRALPWCNPEQLRPWLVPVARGITADSLTAIPADAAAGGLAIHLGSHVAALWEDRAPLGKLDADDLVAHHLSGLPEVIPLRQLLKGHAPKFDLLRAPGPADAAVQLVFGGDVILTNETLAASLPPALAGAVQQADFAMANLECSPADGTGPFPDAPRKPFPFITDATRAAAWCRAQGLDAVTLGNNHAEDAGPAAFVRGCDVLRRAGLPATGAGATLARALEPVIWEKNGLRIACFSMNFVNAENFAAGEAAAGTLSLPGHAADLAAAFQRLREAEPATLIIALPHWGREGLREVSALQREWARWLIDHGAAAVIGCGPHLCQDLDAWRGRPVCYSTGNLHAHTFGPPENAARQLLRLALSSDGTAVSMAWVE